MAMSLSEAREYAPQWGSYMSAGDPGACMYGEPSEPATARAMIAHIESDCLPIARAGDCCGTAGECAADVEALGELLAYLRTVAR